VDQSTDIGQGNLYLDKLGIVITEATGERVVATMPVEGNTQPDGFLHGGATMSLIETLASVGAALAAGWPERIVMGQQQTCNFLSTATSGTVRGVATPVHTGRSTHVWDVDVTSEETGKRVAAGRVTIAVRDRRTP
jgi:1,4-dihydroxy-2-naphthoyl-CoA hydrolase